MMTTYKLPLDARLLHDYLERRLDPREEQAFEEAMIADPEIAEQVRLELVMREGMRELSRREREKPRSAPQVVPIETRHARSEHHGEPRHARSERHSVRGGRRWVAMAAAAAVALAIGLPTSLLLLRGGGNAPGPGLAQEEMLAPRVESDGQLAAYDLPAQLVAMTPEGEADTPPLRLSLPSGVSEIVLQLPPDAPETPHRLVLSRANQPQVSVALAASRLPDSQQDGFTLATEQLPPGQYRAQIERLENGAWVQDRQFVLRVEGRR